MSELTNDEDWTARGGRHLMGERNDRIARELAAREAAVRVQARTDPPFEVLSAHTQWVTKDSGVRAEFEGGMVRDTQEGKPRFDLITPLGVPYKDQMLTRWAGLMARGAEKYGDRNWEKGEGQDCYDRARASAFRHFMQWFFGELDEDHAVAVFFNIQAAEYFKGRLDVRTAEGEERP